MEREPTRPGHMDVDADVLAVSCGSVRIGASMPLQASICFIIQERDVGVARKAPVAERYV